MRWALDYKRVPHVRRSLLPGLHAVKAKRLTGDTSTAPVFTLDGRSIGDSTRIIAALEERWPQPPLYPADAGRRRRALELEEFFDEQLGPHIRRAFYQELLSHQGLVVPLFTLGQPATNSALLRAGFPLLRVGMRRRFQISPESAATSRAKVVAAMGRLEREISTSGYLVGESFTVADLTAAALFYGVARPREFPYAMVADRHLPDAWREFVDSLAPRPSGKWVAEIYRRDRETPAELTSAQAARAFLGDALAERAPSGNAATSRTGTAPSNPTPARRVEPAAPAGVHQRAAGTQPALTGRESPTGKDYA